MLGRPIRRRNSRQQVRSSGWLALLDIAHSRVGTWCGRQCFDVPTHQVSIGSSASNFSSFLSVLHFRQTEFFCRIYHNEQKTLQLHCSGPVCVVDVPTPIAE